MEKRILLSFALSFLIILAFYQFFSPSPAEVPAEGQPAVAEEASAPPPAQPATSITAPEPFVSEEVIETREGSAVETREAGNSVYTIRISNLGGVIESIQLLDYAGAAGRKPLELLDPDVDAAVGWPLELMTGDPVLDERLRTSLWVLEGDESHIRLELAGEGLVAFKEISIGATGYDFSFTAGVRMNGRSLPISVVWQGGFGDQATDYSPASVNLVYLEGRSFERVNVDDFAESPEVPATEFVGLEDRYFLVMFHSPTEARPMVRGLALEGPEAVPIPRIEFPYAAELAVYVGPKQRDDLRDFDPQLASVINYGFFQILAQPLLSVLLVIHSWIGNFGWSIILMTLLVNALLFPLRLKQQLSMLKMQKIQPQMRTLQDKYKKLKPNDPRRQEVQNEMMGLYQKHGVNPLGGCLPMVLQMPIFIAIFQLLRTAIELRQAPWMLWIQDLSAYDPYYVLPILMGVAMVVSQRTMPSAMDPSQARMMMFMPLVFMVFMIRAQSGLVLYWLTSQLVGVGQQLVITRYWVPKGKKGTSGGAGAPSEPASPSPVAVPESATTGEKRRRRRKR